MALPAAAGSGFVRCGVVQSDDTLLGYLYRKVWFHIDPMDGGLGVLTDSHTADRLPLDRQSYWMSVHETLRRWLIDAADAAIEYAARDEIDEGARKFREAIETAAVVAYESQMLPVLGNLNRDWKLRTSPAICGVSALSAVGPVSPVGRSRHRTSAVCGV